MSEHDLYSFVYRGVLTEEALDKTERRRRSQLGNEEIYQIQKSLSFELLESELLNTAKRMSLAYTAIHAFENSVRALVTKAMLEAHSDAW